MKLRNFLTTLTLLTTSAFAADPIDIVGVGSDPAKQTPIAVSGYSGEVDAILRFDLSVAGFKFVPADQANYRLTGSNAAQVEGRLMDGGKNVLAKAYTGGTPRSQA